MDLLDAMEANPDFCKGDPSSQTTVFLSRIEAADPTSPDLSEEDDNASWGHYQFTAGSLTCTSTLTSWEAVGNTEVARKLIAAAIKTSKVARHICFVRRVNTDTYLSDIYLERIIETLWEVWRSAKAVCYISHIS